MKNSYEYNRFIQTLETRSPLGMFYHTVGNDIYITSYEQTLLGVWDGAAGTPKSNAAA